MFEILKKRLPIVKIFLFLVFALLILSFLVQLFDLIGIFKRKGFFLNKIHKQRLEKIKK